jgi:amidase
MAGAGSGARGQEPAGKPGSSQTPPAAGGPGADFELREVGIEELDRRMASGELTALRATELYLERIAALDPQVRSVLEVNPDAQAIARALDAERSAGRVRGPLHGVPILLKDNIDTADRMTTTAGSLALEGSVPARDSRWRARCARPAPSCSARPT